MFTSDMNSLPNDPAADAGTGSDVFSNVIQSAGIATAQIVNAVNAPQIQQQRLQVQSFNTSNLLLIGSALVALYLIVK